MCNRRKQNYVSRLDSDGWVDMYDPLVPRREWAGENDGPQEFLQKPSSQDYWHKFGLQDVATNEQQLLRRSLENSKHLDPKFPWLERNDRDQTK